MDRGPLAEQIIKTFDDMPAQLQAGARYVLDRPRDVALLSMREQARQAGVQPATMTRLAKRLGMEGYDEVRELYAAAVRDGGLGFAGKAGVQLVSQKLKGDRALAADMLKSIGKQIERLAAPANLDRLVAAARALTSARRVYCAPAIRSPGIFTTF
jgi:DNA-binding MurR/RpiR family transcriptional regulator